MKNVILVSAVLALVSACAEDGATSADGKGCANVGEYGCFDNVVHLCHLENGAKVWDPRTDCGASAEPTCTCVVNQGLGMCTTGGSSNVSLQCQQ